MKEIVPHTIKDTAVTVPGSKSYTHRIVIAAALSDGECQILNPLQSEDTLLTVNGLQQMEVPIDVTSDRMVVKGTSGVLNHSNRPIHLGNSGTSIRLLTGICAIGNGSCILDGTERMRQRPIQDLLDALTQLGVSAKTLNGNGCPPVQIEGTRIRGGAVSVKCGISSQYLSSLLLMAPYTTDGLDITVIEGPVSRPYVDMTLEIMEQFGVKVERDGYTRFQISGRQIYRSGCYQVEPDYSQASYFWGIAAINRTSIKVKGTILRSRQGDVRFVNVLERMGCRVVEEPDGIRVSGEDLTGLDVDMSDIPDMVPTLAVVAAFASGETTIRNVSHLKAKESDRLSSVVTELRKMGIEAHCTDTGMSISGGFPKGAEIETYDDHRIAMSFAMAGLKVPGIVIRDQKCVGKSFPNFWEVFESLS